MAELYNPEIKEEFLSQYPENTRETYRYVFIRSKATEDIIGRDLYTFSADEIISTLKDANHTTLNAIRHSWNIIKLYLDWAVRYSGSNINQAKNITMDELRNCLDKSKKLYMTEEELIEIEDKAANAQDIVALRLIFEGVGGSSLSEVCNLNYNDIDWNNNKLTLKDDKHGEREITVSDRCIKIIKSAYLQSTYYKNNGQSTARNPEAELQKSDYILQNIQTNLTKNVNGVDRHTIYRRVTTLSESFDLPYLTPKNVEKSGMIKMAYDLYKESGKLDNEELEKIADRFSVRKVKIAGVYKYNYQTLREFINMENIKELYLNDEE
ncbi:phage lytic cycle repressor MrpR family protein [Metabacillus sp. Hm71]|uniref:phage lytic cycle repressor MrpR family protein n=1 Tax=Metabacillus sp. Hm71 TaxID=3450743 RepID=UPI003F4427F8